MSKIVEKIGEGGMGAVYRAEDTNLSCEVVVKLRPEFTVDCYSAKIFKK